MPPDSVIRLLERALSGGAAPGIAFGLVRADGSVERFFGGLAQQVPAERPLEPTHVFDLASLTKVMFTTPCILMAAADGKLDLDAPLCRVLPDYRQYHPACPERQVTPRQCLGHMTPFPAVAPLYTCGLDQATIRAFLLQREFPLLPDGRNVYSDINFLLLGLALERLEGRRVCDLEPGYGLTFTPDPARAVATEHCTWRGRVMVGEVHDENAWAFGGAGHAGLFGSLDAVLAFARGLLDGTGLPADVLAVLRQPLSDTCAHGFERRHPGWSGGEACSAATLGHTGFTGTGLWIDFDRGLAWALLTNRVHPTRHSPNQIPALRSAVGNAIIEAAVS